MAKTILKGTIKITKREMGNNMKDWTILEFSGSVRAVVNRIGLKRIVEMPCVVPRRPSRMTKLTQCKM